MTWETPVTTLLPSFKLGDPDTTQRVLVKHLICACTGLPRQDFEWLLQVKGLTPEGMIGYHSDMIWLPQHGVGAVILTNGAPGWLIRGNFSAS